MCVCVCVCVCVCILKIWYIHMPLKTYLRSFVILQTIKLLSDLGGSVGLWLGFSIITVFEFVEFFVDICKLLSYQLFRKHHPTVAIHE